MDTKRFLESMEEMLELSPGTLELDARLDDVDWGSLAAVQFIAFADEHFNVVVSPSQLASSQTVQDLLALVGDEVSVGR